MSEKIKRTMESKCAGRVPIIENYKKNNNGWKIHNFDLVKNIEDKENCWKEDRYRILKSKAFWRLQNKTQIFIQKFGVHYSDRMTHTLLVNEIAREILNKLVFKKGIILNESLTEAIALGHDLGHTPFGHEGEKTINELLKKYKSENDCGFAHNIQSARVVINIEWDKIWTKTNVGLGLTWEVISGIILHTDKNNRCKNGEREYPDELERLKNNNLYNKENLKLIPTSESKVVYYADEIAQRIFDIEDGLQANIIKKENVEELLRMNSTTNSFTNDLRDKFIDDIINNELLRRDFETIYEFPFIIMCEKNENLKCFIKDNIHENSIVKSKGNHGSHIIETLFRFYLENWKNTEERIEEINNSCNQKPLNVFKNSYKEKNKLPEYFLSWDVRENEKYFELSKERVIANYIASMTDRFAEFQFEQLSRNNLLEFD